MKRYDVLLTQAAEADLEALDSDLRERVSPEKADAILDQILEAASSLSTFPDRGACPQELAWLGVRDYQQIQVLTFRLIYRRLAQQVVIYVIADGRRDFQSLLERRLLNA